MTSIALAAFAGFLTARYLTTPGLDGPFSIFYRLRAWAGIVPPLNTLPEEPFMLEPKALIGGLLECVYCASFWTCTGWWAVAEFVDPLLVAPFAAAGATMIAIDIWAARIR